jgi:hypothetical protein
MTGVFDRIQDFTQQHPPSVTANPHALLLGTPLRTAREPNTAPSSQVRHLTRLNIDKIDTAISTRTSADY